MTNLEKLKTATPGQIRDMFCEDCDKCPSFIFERCDAGKNGFAEWLNDEAKTQKDASREAPKGWIKLKITNSDIYIDASKIVGLSQSPSNASVTEVYTIGGEDSPWLVDDSADEVIEKIEKAKQEK